MRGHGMAFAWRQGMQTLTYPIELYSTDDLLSLPEPEWLLEGHIHQCEVGVIYGQANVGKSFVALDWALSVATGTPWLGRFATKQGPVLYLCAEGAWGLRHRVQAWLTAHGQTKAPVYFQTRAIPLLEAETVHELIAAIDDFRVNECYEPGFNPALIVVDTLSQYLMGGDEIGPDMAQFVANVRTLSQERVTAALIVHHTNKGGEQERGHTALRGNVDVMFKLHQDSATLKGQSILTLSNDKQRDAALASSVELELTPVANSLVVQPPQPAKYQAIMAILREKGPLNRQELLSAAAIKGVSSATVDRYLRDSKKTQ